jgi:hypothetical protein
MKKDRDWFVICGKRTNCYMIEYVRDISFEVEYLGFLHNEMFGNNTGCAKMSQICSKVLLRHSFT